MGLANFSILRLIETNHTRLRPRSKHAVVSGAMHARVFMQGPGRFSGELALVNATTDYHRPSSRRRLGESRDF